MECLSSDGKRINMRRGRPYRIDDNGYRTVLNMINDVRPAFGHFIHDLHGKSMLS